MFSTIHRSLILVGALILLLPWNGAGGKPPAPQTAAQRAAAQRAAAKREAAERAARRKHVAYLKKLPKVQGIVFHACSCPVPCPCMFNDKDVEGCNIVRIYHITDGGYVGKQIAGLTVVYVPHPDDLKKKEGGLLKEGKPVDGALYLPSGLTKQQESNLLSTLAEQTMSIGWNNNLLRHAKIVFRKLADGYDVEVGKIFQARMRTAKGVDKKPIIVDNLALSEGARWYLGRSLVHEYQDAEEKAWRWSLPKTNGSWTFVAWGPHIDPSDEGDEDDK